MSSQLTDDPPVFVLIPGAWHRSTCYDKVVDLLKTQYGLPSYAVTLPSTAGNPKATFKEDVDAARAVIQSQINANHDVVVVAHSYGGMVGNSAIKNLTAPRITSVGVTNEEQEIEKSIDLPRQHYVIGLVLISSGFTLTGLAFMDPFFGRPPPSWRKNTATGFAELVTPGRQLFYHDLPRAEAEHHVSQLTPQSLRALFEGGEYAYAGWRDLPTAVWYIGTSADKAFPVVAQRMVVGFARGVGQDVVHHEMPTSHSPFLSKPEETTRLLVAAATEFRSGFAEGPAGLRRRRKMMVGFWPHRWLRHGFWAGFGEILGRCVVGWERVQRWWRR